MVTTSTASPDTAGRSAIKIGQLVMLVSTDGYTPPMGSVSEISERSVHARVPGNGRAAKTAFHSTGYAALAASAIAILHLADMKETVGMAQHDPQANQRWQLPGPVQLGRAWWDGKKSRSQHGRTD